MRRLTRLFRDRSGATAVEFALIGFPFILLLLGLMEFGRGLHIRTALDDVADRAQRAILIDPTASTGTIEAQIWGAFRAGQPDLVTVAYASETTAGIDYRLVTLSYQMNLLLPAPLGGPVTMRSTRRIVMVQ